MNPKYPIYIVTKGRFESRLTVKELTRMNVPFRVVIEPQEYEQYATILSDSQILVLPFSNLGLASIPARNWIWEHAIGEGHARHWILDDNLRQFYRLNHNKRLYMGDGTGFRVIEDFSDRYTNVMLSGMHYRMFAPSTQKRSPYLLNTRVYSCILINHQLDLRWRGLYNEDTDLSLRVLKQGYCTVLFYAFLCNKIATMLMKGGNTDELYHGDGRLKMAQSLQMQHPDCVRITYRWGRWQHLVNYSRFKHNALVLKSGIQLRDEQDEYGLKLIEQER